MRHICRKKVHKNEEALKKVIHMEKSTKTGKNRVINGVIHFIHIKSLYIFMVYIVFIETSVLCIFDKHAKCG